MGVGLIHRALPRLAHAAAGQLLAVRLDADAFVRGLETEAAGDAILEQRDVFVLELDDLVAVVADQVIVLRLLQEVRVVIRLVAAQVDLVQQLALHQQAEGAIHRRAADGAVDFARHVQKLLSGEVLGGAEGGLHDDIARLRPAQSFAEQVAFESFADLRVHGRGMVEAFEQGARSRARMAEG